MVRQARVSPALNGEEAASAKAAPSQMRVATPHEATENALPRQDEARRCEGIARRHALAALLLGGGMAFSEAATATHYARRSLAIMRGERQ